ncbi:hypothetical protein IWZ00DRAFT_296887 [Phyllosticta capitalensis]|uniref:uncharacterized protein n=1 Tax=Phyllosticta capitalensis TaxID=121624 RepID=UPI00312E0DE4
MALAMVFVWSWEMSGATDPSTDTTNKYATFGHLAPPQRRIYNWAAKMYKGWLQPPDQLLPSKLIGYLLAAISNERMRNADVNVHWPGFTTEGVPRKFNLPAGDPCLMENPYGTISFAMLGSYCLCGDVGRVYLHRQFLVDNGLAQPQGLRRSSPMGTRRQP